MVEFALQQYRKGVFVKSSYSNMSPSGPFSRMW